MNAVRSLVAFGVVLATVQWCGAEAENPSPGPKDVRLNHVLLVRIDDSCPSARLLIPQAYVRNAVDAAVHRRLMILGGVFLAAVAVIAGLWWVRRRSPRVSGGALLLIGVVNLLTAGAALVWANAPPSPPGAFFVGQPSVQIVDGQHYMADGQNYMVLVVNREELGFMADSINAELGKDRGTTRPTPAKGEH